MRSKHTTEARILRADQVPGDAAGTYALAVAPLRLRARIRSLLTDPRAGQGVIALQMLSLDRWLDAFPCPPEVTVSIITATRDRLDFLRAAAESVVGQRESNWEWIVVNDGAPRSCAEVVDRDERIHLVEANGVGLAAARNRGLDTASGSVVCYLDDDNLIHPRYLEALTFALHRHPNATWGYGARLVETPQVTVYPELGAFPYIDFPVFSTERLRRRSYIDANTIFHRRGDWRFDEATKTHSDWELVLQLAGQSDPLRVPAISCLYRTAHEGRMSRADDRRHDTDHIRAKHGL